MSAAAESPNLEDYTVTELKEMLDERGIEYTSSARKAELIELLENEGGA